MAAIDADLPLQNLIAASPDGTLVVDTDGVVLFANPAAARLFGRRDSLVGMAFGYPMVSGETTDIDIPRRSGDRAVAEMRVTETHWAGRHAFVVALRDVTNRRTQEERLRLFERVIACSSNGVVIADAHQPDHPVTYVNPAFERITGYGRTDVEGHNLRLLQADDRDQPEILEIRQALREQRDTMVVLRNYRKDGTLFWNSLLISPVHDAYGRITHFVGLQTDVTEAKEAEQRARLAARVFESTAEGIIVTDLKGKILDVNPAFTRITGYLREEVLGLQYQKLHLIQQGSKFTRQWRRGMLNSGQWQGQVWSRRKNGENFPAWLIISAIRNERMETGNYVGLFVDWTTRKLLEEGLHRLAYYDELTDLPNRTLFREALQKAMAKAERHHRKIALMFLDLDRFKQINDTLGHYLGDQLLKLAAQRLKSHIRDGDLLARLGGDEFTVVLEDLVALSDAQIVAQKILAVLAQSFTLDGHEIFVTTSIGISFFPDDARDMETLIINADTAMYRAKEAGRNTYRFYSADMNRTALARLDLENGLRRALARDELLLHFQPLIDLRTGELAGVEALLRWRHPEKGLVYPDEFIPAAEETGLILAVGEWTLAAACSQARSWDDQGLAPFRVAINVSARQFRQERFLDVLARYLREHSLPPGILELEVTESTLMNLDEATVNLLREIRQAGMSIVIDDFGTGYSSLSYLTRLPIDGLKIDRSFIRGLEEGSHGTAIVEAILALAHSLGLRVVAEGVETAAQLNFLKERGCPEAQGFYFSYPITAEELNQQWTSPIGPVVI